jgi:polyphenol oxidase
MNRALNSEGRKSNGWTERASQSVPGVTYVVPEPEPEEARIWFFTRRGGVSDPPYDSLNVATKVGDKRSNVVENLARTKSAMDGRPSAWTQLVAGNEVARVTGSGLAGEADALITDRRGLSLVIAAADCAPVVLVGKRAVAIAHSGWRGTLSGVTAKTVLEMDDTKIKAYIGPCIRECCYEVSAELAEKFAERFGPEVVSGRYLSLPTAIRKNINEAGLEEVYDLGPCTGCRPDLFYSHRKQGPYTGRNLMAVARS